MINEYISNINKWLQDNVAGIISEKNFLYLIGSLFVLGIVSKWMVMACYGRLIRKAENMAKPKSKTLRQIKMKFEGVKQVNGVVANPMLLVKRHLNRCKIGIFSINKMNSIINWCIVAIIGITAWIGWQAHSEGHNEMAAFYIFTGWFVGFSLEIISRSSRVNELKMELAYVIVDYLENRPSPMDVVREAEGAKAEENITPRTDAIGEPVTVQHSQGNNEESHEGDNARDALVLNQVIGEYLQ